MIDSIMITKLSKRTIEMTFRKTPQKAKKRKQIYY